MTLKDFIFAKAKEVRKISDMLDEKFQNESSSMEGIREYARNNGRFEVINEIMRFILDNDL